MKHPMLIGFILGWMAFRHVSEIVRIFYRAWRETAEEFKKGFGEG